MIHECLQYATPNLNDLPQQNLNGKKDRENFMSLLRLKLFCIYRKHGIVLKNIYEMRCTDISIPTFVEHITCVLEE
jgi:hypothetical protein